jgi:hypothetical protein
MRTSNPEIFRSITALFNCTEYGMNGEQKGNLKESVYSISGIVPVFG